MRKIFTFLITITMFLSLSTGAFAQSNTGHLTVNKAINLSTDAHEHYRSFKIGHKISQEKPECSSATFNYKGTEYKYFCSDFNTKEKLIEYLNEIFTLNAIEKALKKYMIIDHKGKLAYPANDDNSFLLWNTAKGKLIYQRNGVKQFEFTLKEETENLTEKRKITFVKVGKQWLINDISAAW